MRPTLTIAALGKPREQDCEFKASLIYIVTPFLKPEQEKREMLKSPGKKVKLPSKTTPFTRPHSS